MSTRLEAFLATVVDLRWWLVAIAFLLVVLAYVDALNAGRAMRRDNERLRRRVRELETNERVARMGAGRPGWRA